MNYLFYLYIHIKKLKIFLKMKVLEICLKFYLKKNNII